MTTETDLRLSDGRTVHVYDTGVDGAGATLTVLWHHGTPQVGEPLAPFVTAGRERGVRWIAHDRPGYGGSTRQPGRTVASAAGDAAAVADALGVDRFAVAGHSGGGPHALGCAALLPERVTAAVCFASLAPLGADGLDWYAGMAASGAAELRAAVAGAAALDELLAASEFDMEQFTPSDHAALAGTWAGLGASAARAMNAGPAGMIDDDLAYVAPWGFDITPVSAPLLLVHGEADRIVPASHSRWLATQSPPAELWLRPGDGHLSVLDAYDDALDWLLRREPGSSTYDPGP